MPFENNYNQAIKLRVKNIARNKVAHDSVVAEYPANIDPTTQHEFATVDNPDLVGGSGDLAATVRDLGIEPKIVGGELKAKKVVRKRVKKLVDVMENTQPITKQQVEAALGDNPKPKKVRVKKLKTGGDWNDIMNGVKSAASTVGEVVKTGAQIAPYVAPLLGLGKKEKKAQPQTEWNALVSKVRKEQNLSLKDTLKYIKEHNLYTKKTKVKGGSRLSLNSDNVKASQGDMGPEIRAIHSVPAMKFN